MHPEINSYSKPTWLVSKVTEGTTPAPLPPPLRKDDDSVTAASSGAAALREVQWGRWSRRAWRNPVRGDRKRSKEFAVRTRFLATPRGADDCCLPPTQNCITCCFRRLRHLLPLTLRPPCPRSRPGLRCSICNRKYNKESFQCVSAPARIRSHLPSDIFQQYLLIGHGIWTRTFIWRIFEL